MSKQIGVANSYTYQGVSYNSPRTVVADNEASSNPTGGITAAVAGTLTLRTDNDTGELTLPGHSITTGQRVDVYWATGSRIGMTVGTVAGDVVPVDGGAGDNLPILTTALRAKVPQSESMTVTGANVYAALATFAPSSPSDYPATIVFATAGDVTIKMYELTAASPVIEWDMDMPDTTNPFSGQTVGKVFFSHGNTDAARVMTASLLFN